MESKINTTYPKLLDLLGEAEKISALELLFYDNMVFGFRDGEKIFKICDFPLSSFQEAFLKLPSKILIRNKVFSLKKNFLKTKTLLTIQITLWPEEYNLKSLPWLLSELENYLEKLKPLNFIIGRDALARRGFWQEINSRLLKFSKKPVCATENLLDSLFIESPRERVWYFPAHLWQLDLEFLVLLREAKTPSFLEARYFNKIHPKDTFFKVRRLKKLCSVCKIADPLPKKGFLNLLNHLEKKDLEKFAIYKPNLYKKEGCRVCNFQGYNEELLVWESDFSKMPFQKTLPLLALAGEIDQDQVLQELA